MEPELHWDDSHIISAQKNKQQMHSFQKFGVKETKELAVMVDTFRPLMLTKQALEIENENYIMSWAE